MTTAGDHPAFVILGVQFYNATTSSGVAANPGLPPVYLETSWWPLEMASQNPSTEQLVNVMHRYAKGDAVDFDDEEGAESWLLWAKSASACGTDLTTSCVLSHAAATKNWDAGGIQAPVASLSMSNLDPQPSPCFALLKVEPNKFVYDKALTRPTQSIWNCNPKNIVHLTPQERQDSWSVTWRSAGPTRRIPSLLDRRRSQNGSRFVESKRDQLERPELELDGSVAARQRGHRALKQIRASHRHEGTVQRHAHVASGSPHLAQADHHSIGAVGPLDRFHAHARSIDRDHPALTATGDQRERKVEGLGLGDRPRRPAGHPHETAARRRSGATPGRLRDRDSPGP